MNLKFIYLPDALKCILEDYYGSFHSVDAEDLISKLNGFDLMSVKGLTEQLAKREPMLARLGITPFIDGLYAKVAEEHGDSLLSLRELKIDMSRDNVLILYGNEVATKRFVERVLIFLSERMNIEELMGSELFQTFAEGA